MNSSENQVRIVRYGELTPCKTAFIDAHTPGSDKKENFTIIGAGVAESSDQHVHIRDTPGFNIGAAGQPPGCKNSMHTHRTAETFFVLKGRWRFFWGQFGDAGEVILQEGDIFDIPTGVFRGFENVGTDYGMIMSMLGGDDAGGGVIWAPHVIKKAKDYGLILAESGRLYDTKQGESLPDGVKPMPLMTETELAEMLEPDTRLVVSNYVARYWDLMSMSDTQPIDVIGAEAIIRDRPGYEVDFISRNSLSPNRYICGQSEVLIPVRGHWRLDWDDGCEILNPGDTCLVEPGVARLLQANVSGESSLYRIRNTDDPAGPTMSLDD